MMREGFSGKTPHPGLSPEERERRNRGVLSSLMVVCGLALFLVEGLPGALIAPALGLIFALASIGAGFVAIMWREPVLAAHLTHWDKAAVLIGLSIVAGVFTDTALVEQTLAEFVENNRPGRPADDGRISETPAPPTAGADPTGL